MANHDFRKGYSIFLSYLFERFNNLMSDGAVNIFLHSFYLYKFILVIIYDFATKASVANPILTAFIPTMFFPTLIIF